MSFILDALRKSEHERQRSAVPGLSQVPLAAPPPQVPRWALGVIAALAAALFVIGGAWWQTARTPQQAAQTVERSVELPPPASPRTTPPQATQPRALSQPGGEPSLRSAAAPAPSPTDRPAPSFAAPRQVNLPDDAAQLGAPSTPSPSQTTVAPDTGAPSTATLTLPRAAALAAEGIAIPTLRLELHAYSERPRDRFVFINGRKYAEGDRLPEGPQLVAIEPTGAVLTHAGRRFLLVQD